ncbi:MAG: hypothetical protein EDM75_13075 [Chlorobiota bacterium]|nr:MAG: hypothetical protein EDM75_13075 [Chlorobiota bacterium]
MNVYIEEQSLFPKSLAISVAIHLLVVVAVVVISRFASAPQFGSKMALQMTFDRTDEVVEQVPQEKPLLPEQPKDDDPSAKKEPSQQPPKPAPKGLIAGAFDAVDSTLLDLEYKETTLNVRMRYSEGWAFLDDKGSSKLDAVTFWNPNVPNSPWVQLRVTDKYLFRESRYKQKEEFDDYTVYYNAEEELEGEVKFEVYLRTETSEDYIITYRVKGMDTFKKYRPVFMAMLKSFRFGLF